MGNENTIILLGKLPRLGLVKTRLGKTIGKELSLKLYEAFLSDFINLVASTDYNINFFYYPNDITDFEKNIFKCSKKISLFPQSGDNLGEKMEHAISRSISLGAKKFLVFGIDTITIRKKEIVEFFDDLKNNDYILGESLDGGYYTIGSRFDVFEKSVFSNIEWSTGRVFSSTIKNILSTNKTYKSLSKKNDIDNFQDLKELINNPDNIDFKELTSFKLAKEIVALERFKNE